PIDFSVTPMVLHVDVQGAVNFQVDTIITKGMLRATKKDTIKITDLLPVSLSGSYNITAWLELPIDAFSEDDTIQSVYVIDKISIPYTINFDTMPKGLVFKQFAGSSHWTVESGDGVNPIISPSHGSGRLQFLSESGLGSMARVTLQPFNLKGSASPQMKFWYAHDNGNPMSRDYTEVKISIDGGTTYSTLLNLQRYNAAYATPTFVRYEIDLSPYTAYSCVILAFEAGSYGGGNQNIDSIAIISKQDLAINLSIPDQSELVACELDNHTIAVSLRNMTSQMFDLDMHPTQINVKVTGADTATYTIPLTTGILDGDTIIDYVITNTFDLSKSGAYDVIAYLTAADDNLLNDTVRADLLINVDAELIAVDAIDSKDEGDLVYPTIYLTNNGNIPINGIPLSVTINNVQVLTENIDTLLNAGDTITYTFENPYTVPYASEQQPYYQMKVAIDLDCDGNSNNNSSSKFYNVNVEGSIDLSIVQILYPLKDSCLSGHTKVYPSIEVFNSGTGYAQGAKLYVLVDSAEVQTQSFVETLDDVPSQTSITFNCSKYYVVPNFKDTYTVTFSIEFEKDANQGNNSKSVVACAEEVVSVPTMTALSWSLGQNIPNPAAANMSIPYTLPEDGKVQFKVMSINGQVLYQESIDAVQGVQYLDFNADNLAVGIYYYSMEYKGQRIVKKMTIQK
ncbi:MAG: T9SS type A sorting domain-containing protein, partial [Bacteroidales bacterium]